MLGLLTVQSLGAELIHSNSFAAELCIRSVIMDSDADLVSPAGDVNGCIVLRPVGSVVLIDGVLLCSNHLLAIDADFSVRSSVGCCVCQLGASDSNSALAHKLRLLRLITINKDRRT